jgi:hypothetical protein
MAYMVFRVTKKILLPAASMALLIWASVAMADPPPAPKVIKGCDPKVMEAMQAKAQANVAYDVAVTEQIVHKPDSVLAMTCFNQSAGVSAKEGGDIFSGDFTDDLEPIVEPALADFYGSDFDDSEGMDDEDMDGMYAAAASELSDTFDCNKMKDLWENSEKDGIHTDVPYATFDDMVNNTPPAGAGDDFTADWNAAKDEGVLDNLKTATDALPKPEVPDFSNTTSSCDVLAKAGISTDGCGGP